MAIFGNWFEKLVGGPSAVLGPDFIKYGKTGQGTFDAGNALTDEGLNDLRGYRSDYAERLKNPLGTGPNSASGIFSRTRGALSDTANQRAGAFGSRLAQQAVQNGGNLSPEARAQLQEQNQRGINEDVFRGNVDISNQEAALTLSETSKLFDRMEGISKTILGVGQDKSLQGLQAVLASLGLRLNRNQAIASSIVAGATRGAAGGSSQPTPVSGITGRG